MIARRILWRVLAASLVLAALTGWSGHPVIAAALLILAAIVLLTLVDTVRRQFKTIREGPAGPGLSWHFARWNLDKYDRFLATASAMLDMLWPSTNIASASLTSHGGGRTTPHA